MNGKVPTYEQAPKRRNLPRHGATVPHSGGSSSLTCQIVGCRGHDVPVDLSTTRSSAWVSSEVWAPSSTSPGLGDRRIEVADTHCSPTVTLTFVCARCVVRDWLFY